MEEKRVGRTVAKLAKEKGFDYLTHYVYYFMYGNEKDPLFLKTNHPYKNDSNDVSAPTQSYLQQWLREVHNVHIVIQPEGYKKGVNYLFQVFKLDSLNDIINSTGWYNDNNEYPGYEGALEKALEIGLDLI